MSSHGITPADLRAVGLGGVLEDGQVLAGGAAVAIWDRDKSLAEAAGLFTTKPCVPATSTPPTVCAWMRIGRAAVPARAIVIGAVVV